MSSKPTVGHVTGDLTLTIDGNTVALGAVDIPLVTETIDSHRGEIAVKLRADLVEVRRTISAIFAGEAS